MKVNIDVERKNKEQILKADKYLKHQKNPE